jgi:hypothetical protein
MCTFAIEVLCHRPTVKYLFRMYAKKAFAFAVCCLMITDLEKNTINIDMKRTNGKKVNGYQK